LDRVTGISYSDGSSVAYTYDGDGNLTRRVLTAGTSVETTTYSPDPLNRITQVAYSPTGGTTNYTYDSVGNMLTMQDAGGTVTYGYDPANRLTSLAEPGGSCTAPTSKCTTYSYDIDDNRTTTSYPNGVTIRNDYDNADRLTCTVATKSYNASLSCPQQPSPIQRFSYNYINPANNTDGNVYYSVTDASGNVTAYGYDNLDRLASANKNTGADVYNYAYDKVGNITSRTHTVPGSPTTTS
jgi:YD repeat-containing protein